MASTIERERTPVAANGAKRSPIRADIQGLRMVAVGAVILNHLFAWPTGAFVGVDVFFVISGFLITGLLLREYERDGRISFVGFYARRVKRIMPAATLVLVVTSAAALLLFTASRAVHTLWDAFWAFFFAANWNFALAGTDYFNEGSAISPFQHYWSLSIEEQFYFVWPWLLVLLFALGARSSAWSRRRARLSAGVAMTLIIAASLILGYLETENDAGWAYFSTTSRAWELGVGALLAVIAPALARIPAAVRPVIAWAGLTAIVAALFITPQTHGFPVPFAGIAVIGSALTIAAGTGGPVRYLWPLTNPVATWIGNLSYSLYLWHWPIIVLLAAIIPTHTVVFAVVALALTAGLSAASYYGVEGPLRRMSWSPRTRARGGPSGRRTHRGAIIAVTVVSAAALGLGGMAVAVQNVAPSPPHSTAATTGAPDASGHQVCAGAAALDTSASCETRPAPLQPTVDSMAEDTGGAFRCWIAQGAPVRHCTYGSDAPSAQRVALVGDSHAASLIPALGSVAGENGWHLDTYVGYGCRWQAAAPGDDGCGAMKDIQAELERGGYDVVLTTAARGKTGPDKAAAAKRFSAAWKPVLASGTRVVVIGDVPEVSGDALQCIQRVGFDPSDNDCGTTTTQAFTSEDVLVTAAKHTDGVRVVDVADLMCTHKECPAVLGNVLVYRDGVSHITATFAKTLVPYLSKRLSAAVG